MVLTQVSSPAVDEAAAADTSSMETTTEMIEGEGGGSPAAEEGSSGVTEEEKVVASLESMGFMDRALIKSIISKVGLDVEACAHELVGLSEWDAMLSDPE